MDTNTQLNEIVTDWLFQSQFEDGEFTMIDIVHDEPELAWSAILQILTQDLSEMQTALLGAGPLESLLGMHGAQFIDRVEQEAKQNERFNHLLGGVWKNQMPKHIWQRVECTRKNFW